MDVNITTTQLKTNMEPDTQSTIAESHYELAMKLVQEKKFVELKGLLDTIDDNTGEAIRESLNAEDFNSLMNV